MPVVKYIPIHGSPLALIKYVTKECKTDNTLVSGINCSSDAVTAFEEMKLTFEHFSGMRFYKKSLAKNGERAEKEPVRVHHYVQSFKPGEVTPEEAHQIGKEWAEKMFGENFAVIFATHTDRDHIHNHFTVVSYGFDGKRWYGNKETLKRCRAVSDEIAKVHGLSVIENPKYQPRQKYGEYKARREGSSWKQRLCDDIDSAILAPNVQSTADLAEALRAKSYIVTVGKYLSIKVRPDRKAIRSFRLGDGYSIEHLEYRIANKNMEMPLSEVMKYEGIGREYAICIRQIQIELYRTPERDRLHFATYREVEKSLKLLNFISLNGISSVKTFENKIIAAEKNVNSLAAERDRISGLLKSEERLISAIPKYLEIRSRQPMLAKDIRELAEYSFVKDAGVIGLSDIAEHEKKTETLRTELAAIDEEIKNAKSEHKEILDFYEFYYERMKSDYQVLLERAKAENIRNEEIEKPRETAKQKFARR